MLSRNLNYAVAVCIVLCRAASVFAEVTVQENTARELTLR
jgi:hypothetical protein